VAAGHGSTSTARNAALFVLTDGCPSVAVVAVVVVMMAVPLLPPGWRRSGICGKLGRQCRDSQHLRLKPQTPSGRSRVLSRRRLRVAP
jgi:hypothetical protein